MEIEQLVELLGRRVSEPDCKTVIQRFKMLADHSMSNGVYWEAPGSGISLLVEDARVATVFLHAQGKDGFDQYQGVLPKQLSFDLSQEAVRGRLGNPSATSSAGVRLTDGMVAWDRYEFEKYALHLSYGGTDGSVIMVTLESPRSEG